MFPCGEQPGCSARYAYASTPGLMRHAKPVASVDFTDFHMTFVFASPGMVAGALLLALIGLGYAALAATQASQHSASRFFDPT